MHWKALTPFVTNLMKFRWGRIIGAHFSLHLNREVSDTLDDLLKAEER